MKLRSLSLAVAASLSLFAALPASAANFSFTGGFAGDGDIQAFKFSLTSASSVTLQTLGYSGGTNAAGNSVPSGGFDPIVSLFSSSGAHLGEADDGGPGLDALLNINLGPGSYIVTLTQFYNFALGPNLSDGFLFGPGDTNFTENFIDCVQFCDVFGGTRNGGWALDILGVDSAVQTPVPGALPLFATGLGLFGYAAYRRKRKAA